MSRQIFPDEGHRFTYRVVSGSVVSAAGATAVFYANEAGTVLADIRAHNGTNTPGDPVPNSTLTVDGYSLVPLFWGPDGADTVWAQVSGGPLTPVYARSDARIDAATTDANLALALSIAL